MPVLCQIAALYNLQSVIDSFLLDAKLHFQNDHIVPKFHDCSVSRLYHSVCVLKDCITVGQSCRCRTAEFSFL